MGSELVILAVLDMRTKNDDGYLKDVLILPQQYISRFREWSTLDLRISSQGQM